MSARATVRMYAAGRARIASRITRGKSMTHVREIRRSDRAVWEIKSNLNFEVMVQHLIAITTTATLGTTLLHFQNTSEKRYFLATKNSHSGLAL